MLVFAVAVSVVGVMAVRQSDKAMKIAYGKGVQAAETRISKGECNLQIKRGKFTLAKGTKFDDGLPVASESCSKDAADLWNEGMGWQKSRGKCGDPHTVCLNGRLADLERRSFAVGGHTGGPVAFPYFGVTLPAEDCTVVSFDRGCEEWDAVSNDE
ncbi:MAG: hypothetical protein ACSLFF_03490 [Solirubrobacterales bacterium]